VVSHGVRSVDHALVLGRLAALARARGDGDRALRLADSAWHLLTILPEGAVGASVASGGVLVNERWLRGQDSGALAIAQAIADRVTPIRIPVTTIYAQHQLALARMRVRDHAGAEAAERFALAQIPASGDLDPLLPRLRRTLADALDAQGRRGEADSVRALLPPAVPVPRCSPGGDWRGC
jgi:hypothetical protein